jgi:hypothetical protein
MRLQQSLDALHCDAFAFEGWKNCHGFNIDSIYEVAWLYA